MSPSPQAKAASGVLYETLVEPHLASETSDTERRTFVDTIESIFRAFIDSVSAKFAYNGKPITHLYVFGSLRLDLHLEDSDIDMLCLVGGDAIARVNPNALRDAFFQAMPLLLKERLGTTKCVAITKAIVPVIKVVKGGLEADLAFAAVPGVVKREDIDNDMALRGLDERLYQSVSGVRNGECVARALPNPTVFWIVARAVKYWLSRRRLYGSVYGYIGGGAAALLIAVECQKSPHLSPAEIFLNFFRSLYDLTRATLEKHRRSDQKGDFWKPHDVRPGILPIITVSSEVYSHLAAVNLHDIFLVLNPIYPFTNNTRMVGVLELKEIHEECSRALTLLYPCENPLSRTEAPPKFPSLPGPFSKGMSNPAVYTKLVEAVPYIHEKYGFIEISIGSTDEQTAVVNGKFVCTKVRFLLQELSETFSLVFSARPIPVEVTPSEGWMGEDAPYALAVYISLHFHKIANSCDKSRSEVRTEDIASSAAAILTKLTAPTLSTTKDHTGPRVRCLSYKDLPDFAVEALQGGPSADSSKAPKGEKSSRASPPPVPVPRAVKRVEVKKEVGMLPVKREKGVEEEEGEGKREELVPLLAVKIEPGLVQDEEDLDDDVSDDLIIIEPDTQGDEGLVADLCENQNNKKRSREEEEEEDNTEEQNAAKRTRIEATKQNGKDGDDEDAISLAPTSESSESDCRSVN